MLFRLNILRAVVVEVPMEARYGDEQSNLRPRRMIAEFAIGHLRNLGKRILYNYFLRSFSIASVNLVAGWLLVAAGGTFGARAWIAGSQASQFASSGTVMLAALPVIVGVQLLLAFLSYDMGNVPRLPLHRRL